MPAPLSTYRLQLQPAFGFDAAAALAPYLAALGVSHAYCSPYLQAAPGSTHGYDVVDHTSVNEELGGVAGHERMCDAFGAAGLGQVLDIVPNHMAVTAGNRWWWDVLENGPSSRFASYFDVDWDPPEAKLRNTVLMPILGDHYGRVLEAGQLSLAREGGAFTVRYYDHTLPVAPRSLDSLLAQAAARCGSAELAGLARAFGRLPPSWVTDRASVAERHSDKEVLYGFLARLADEEADVAKALDDEVDAHNADADRLDALLERQNYRLAFWRTAVHELDYRRFFDIHTLAALRVEDEDVFSDTHGLVLSWLRRGVIDGLRVDHPDGLRDPGAYFRRLAAWSPAGTWIVAEKITEPGERLPPDWPVAGTTGYDFATRATAVLVDSAGEAALTAAYQAFTGATATWEEVANTAKLVVCREVLSAEFARLTGLLVEVCERHRRYRDYTRHDLDEALQQVTAALGVYRTYVTPGVAPRDSDAAVVGQAAALVKQRRPDIDADLVDFLGTLMLGGHRGPAEDEFVARFQQVSGPVMAKGVEDTACYTFNRLTALNEVGGDPGRFGLDVDAFHAANRLAGESRPAAMLTTSTHDTKRSEDVRARIAVLSEVPDLYSGAVTEWSERAVRHRHGDLPDRNAEWFLYQTLVGTWPGTPLPGPYPDRIVAYMEKASREAKEHTSWTDPNPAYDGALAAFVRAVLADPDITAAVERFASPLAAPGRVKALSQALLKLTCPGVPDIYQGMELWDDSLVDPDNRRPVDWELRRQLLAEARLTTPEAAWADRAGSGLPKLLVTWRALHLRRRRAAAFAGGDYEPLIATGPRATSVIAYARGGEVVTVVPRLVWQADWSDTSVALPAGVWVDALGGDRRFEGCALVAHLFAGFPVALMEKAAAS